MTTVYENKAKRQHFRDQAITRLGETRANSYGSLMTIDEYNSSSSIWVRFLDSGYPVHTSYQAFLNGNVKDPYNKTIFGEGFLGEGKYRATFNGQLTPQYKVWNSMIARCYSKRIQDKQPSYKGVTVCEEWKNFNTFAAWYDSNFYEIDGEKMELDKDILIKGNKIYSPDTCVFVSHFINTLFIKCDVARGNLPVGVNFHKASRKYVAQCRDGKGRKIHLGLHNSPEEAFLAYKEYKENAIKQVANDYKDKIPANLYEAMMNYEIEIND